MAGSAGFAYTGVCVLIWCWTILHFAVGAAAHIVLSFCSCLLYTSPSVLAVDRATLSIEPGKVHAIVGGNGAGKSTLMKMLSGVYPYGSYEGEFYVDGRPCRFRSIMDAEANGISMVPQDLNMVNEMTVRCV